MFKSQLKKQILNNPYYRFQTLEEIQIAIELGITIDVNQANIDDWLRLPLFSIRQAKILVELKEIGVQFLSLEDIATALNIPIHQLQPFADLLVFCYYSPDSLISPQKVNINLATLGTLNKTPLINPTLAEKIITNRAEKGKYKNLLDFQKRLDLTGEEISQLMYYLQF